MTTDLLLIGLAGLTLASYALALVYVVGIVWRVELELDISYKCFAFSVFLLGVTEVLSLLPREPSSERWQIALAMIRFVAAVLLFFGMYFMRDLLRKLNGEKEHKESWPSD